MNINTLQPLHAIKGGLLRFIESGHILFVLSVLLGDFAQVADLECEKVIKPKETRR